MEPQSVVLSEGEHAVSIHPARRRGRHRILLLVLVLIAASAPMGALLAADTTTIEIRIAATDDDVEELGNGWLYRDSSDLEFVEDDSEPQVIGLRFTNLGIPQGAAITAAWIQFTADETDATPTALQIRAVDASDAAPFSGSGGVSTRSTLDVVIPWTPPPWPNIGAAGPDQRTPDLTSLVQSLVALPDWTAESALALVITGAGQRTADSFDGDPATAPLLHIEFTTDGPPPPINLPPTVTASIADITAPGSFDLVGSVTDDGLPDPPASITMAWTQLSGPPATIADPSAVTTTATATEAGTYTFRLTASDGAITVNAERTAVALPAPGGSGVVDIAVLRSGDDVEEQANGWLYTNSSDLELTLGNSSQTVGLRFRDLPIPQGAAITAAWIQFTADEPDSEPTALELRAVAADDAAAFSGSHGVSTLALTNATTAWSPPPWTSVGDDGPDQRTPDLSAVITEVTARPGWAPGNDIAVVITGSGVRTADSYDGSPSTAPWLHVEYTTDPLPPVNLPPTVAATATGTTAPGSIVLDGTIGDDGLPDPPGALTVQWTQTGGPATAPIADPAAVDTTADLPVAGTYVFELTASDGELATSTAVEAVADPEPAPDEASFAVLGDFGTAGTDPDAVATLIDGLVVDYILTTGDNVQVPGSYDDLVGSRYAGYIGSYQGVHGPGAATNRFFPTLGNHDYTEPGGVQAYLDFFTLPGRGFTSSSGTERYYDVVLGPVHVFSIDGYVDTEVQQAWLQQQLALSPSPWQFVLVHFPPYSSGTDHGSSDWVQWPFAEWGADIVLSGHDHIYERLSHDDGSGPIPYVITGLGGAEIDPFAAPVAGSVLRYNGGHGALVADACQTGIVFRFHSVPDGLVDTFTLGDGCGVVPDPPPIANPDSYQTDHGALLTVPAPGVLGNDTGTAPLSAEVLTSTAHGTLTLNADGAFTYQHNGTATITDTFTYRTTGPTGSSNPATVTITIPPPEPPIANPDSYQTDHGALLTVPAPGVLGNDTGTAPLSAEVLTSTAHGTLTLNADGAFTYQHNGTATITDTFTYRTTGPTGSSNPATVTITIPPPADPGNTIRFAHISDYGDPYAGEAVVAAMVDSWNPEFIITTGDNVNLDITYDWIIGQFYAQYIGSYSGEFGPGSPANRFFPSIGKHDYREAGGEAAYYEFFTLPGDGFTSSSGTERYYDFVWGPIHFFSIDSHFNITPQKVWLEEQLAASTSPWQVVYFHFPPYSSGGFRGSSEWMQWDFEAWGADLILSGSSQIYERLSFDIDGDGTAIPYIVNGLGGANIHPMQPPIPGVVFQYNDDYGAGLLEACDAGITYSFFSVSVGMLDQVTIGGACT